MLVIEVVGPTLKDKIIPKGKKLHANSGYNIVWYLLDLFPIALVRPTLVQLQGNGKYLWLMHGMFRSNGGCGYVKKPDFLMKLGPDNSVFDPKAKLQVKKTLKVSTLSK